MFFKGENGEGWQKKVGAVNGNKRQTEGKGWREACEEDKVDWNEMKI